MEIQAVVVGIMLLSSNSEAFLPNRLNSNVYPQDYTHADITETAILRVVVRLLQDNPRNGSTLRLGSLEKLETLDAKSIYDAYYGDGVSAANFQAAIEQIVKANNDIDIHHSKDAAYHFNGEQIEKGNEILLSLRMEIELLLNTTTPDYDRVRETIGGYFHTLQMFYSNTNWIELNEEQVVYDALAARTTLVAGPETKTCYDCKYSHRQTTHCLSNLIPHGRLLTSGYKDGQDGVVPDGKCSHEVCIVPSMMGGINKDSRNPDVSPHCRLHLKAAKTAIKASEIFLDGPVVGLRQVHGDEIIKDLFNIGTGVSLVLVVDITGSMSDEIAAVRQICKEIVTRTAKTANAPFNYILSTFGDPDAQGSVYVTKNSSIFLHYIDALTADGGADCPELPMLGIERGLKDALPDSDVFIFTDAHSKDPPERYRKVTAQVANKKCRLQFVLTDSCSGGVYDHRYRELARKSGGGTVFTDKRNVGKAVRIVLESGMGALVTLIKFTANPGIRKIIIPADDTLKYMIIKITGDRWILATLYKPDGSPAFGTPDVKLETNTTGLMIANVTKITVGNWTVSFDNDKTYDVEVRGKSSFGFTYQIVDEGSPGQAYPITGEPIAGENVSIAVKTYGKDKISVEALKVEDLDGRHLQTIPLQPGTGKDSNLHIGRLAMPNEYVRLSITGKDDSGHDFVRTQATPIAPSNLELKLLKADTDFLIPGGNITVPFTVKNHGSAGNFDVIVSNDKKLRQTITSMNFELAQGQESQSEVTFYANKDIKPGTTSTATFSVSDSTGSILNFVIKRLVVTEPPAAPDLISPLCRTRITEDNCNNTSSFCEKSRWEVSIMAQDVDSGLQAISMLHPGRNTTISVPPFKLGTKSEIVANCSSTCCSNRMIIAVLDVAGNLVYCQENITIPVTPMTPTISTVLNSSTVRTTHTEIRSKPQVDEKPATDRQILVEEGKAIADHLEPWKTALIVVGVVVAIILTLSLLMYARMIKNSRATLNLQSCRAKYGIENQSCTVIDHSIGEDRQTKL